MKKEDPVNSKDIIEIGPASDNFCYAHMNKPPGIAYKLNGNLCSIVKITYRKYLSVIEISDDLNITRQGVYLNIRQLLSLNILIKKDSRFTFNLKKFHLHGKNAVILFGDFLVP